MLLVIFLFLEGILDLLIPLVEVDHPRRQLQILSLEGEWLLPEQGTLVVGNQQFLMTIAVRLAIDLHIPLIVIPRDDILKRTHEDRVIDVISPIFLIGPR